MTASPACGSGLQRTGSLANQICSESSQRTLSAKTEQRRGILMRQPEKTKAVVRRAVLVTVNANGDAVANSSVDEGDLGLRWRALSDWMAT